MNWYQFVLPAITIALLVRLEAIFVGPYWSWLEMLDDINSSTNDRVRRNAFLRRVAIPGVVGFVVVAVFPTTYSRVDAATFSLGAAGLLLWPLAFYGLPGQVRGWRLFTIYASFVCAVCASGWLGAYFALFARTNGSIAEFLQENLISMVMGGVLVLFFTGVATRVSAVASRRSASAE